MLQLAVIRSTVAKTLLPSVGSPKVLAAREKAQTEKLQPHMDDWLCMFAACFFADDSPLSLQVASGQTQRSGWWSIS